MVNLGVGLLADVAGLLDLGFGLPARRVDRGVVLRRDVVRFEILRGEDVRRRDDRTPVSAADRGPSHHRRIASGPRGLPFSHHRLDHRPPLANIWDVDARGSLPEASAIRRREECEQPAIGDDQLEGLGGRAQSLDEGFARGA